VVWPVSGGPYSNGGWFFSHELPFAIEQENDFKDLRKIFQFAADRHFNAVLLHEKRPEAEGLELHRQFEDGRDPMCNCGGVWHRFAETVTRANGGNLRVDTSVVAKRLVLDASVALQAARASLASLTAME
jgi:hypothetical protein